MIRRLGWLVVVPAAVLAWMAPARAEPQPGLNAVGYVYEPTGIPLRVDDMYETCGEEVENNINRNFEGEPFQDCPSEFFMVHYSGFINLPEHTSIQFMVAADDGGTVDIAGTEFGTWDLKGCYWSEPVTLELGEGPQPLDGWFFEWGGGTCYMLAWRIDDGYWEIVPDEAFTIGAVPVTTTTSTTVLQQETTTTLEPTTTTEETTTTTTSTTSTTTTTTTTTQAPPPQTTTAPAPPQTEAPQVTTTVPETTSTEPPAPTSLPELPTTVPPRTTVPETTLPPTTVQTTTTTQVQPTTTAPTPTSLPATTVPQAQAIAEASPQQIVAAITAIQPDQAEQVFAQLDVSSLDEEQQDALIEAVQAAPVEVRAAFEDKVDIFKEGLDDYVPVGSNIPVGQRRVLVAIGAAITAAGAATRMRR